MTDPSLRLAYLVSRYPALSHTFILREVRGLRARGIDVRVASINDPDRPVDGLTAEEREEAARTFYVKRAGARGALAGLVWALCRPRHCLAAFVQALRLGGSDLRRIAYGLFYFVEAAMLGRWLAAQGVTHLHVHFATPAATVGMLVTHLAPVTLSITVHGPDEFYDAPGYHLREKIDAAAFVCCIGAFARSQCMLVAPEAAWEKFELAPLGIDPAEFTPRPPRVAPDPFEILCVGRLVPAKGQRVLVAAVDELVREGRHVRLRLVGNGPDRAALEGEVAWRELGAHVVFEGGVPQDRIRALYAKADAFALASFAEGIPVVLMEAMAMEIPCVTTCITGIPELIRDGVDGLLVMPSDGDALVAALRRLIDDPELARRLGAAGRARVADRYHLPRNIDRLAAIFHSRLSGLVPRPTGWRLTHLPSLPEQAARRDDAVPPEVLSA